MINIPFLAKHYVKKSSKNVNENIYEVAYQLYH